MSDTSYWFTVTVSELCRVAAGGSCDIKQRSVSYHPDFSGVRNAAMLFKHPVVVGQEQLEAEPECEDEGEPQQSAEDQC